MSKKLWRITIDRAITEYCDYDHEALRNKVGRMVKRQIDQMFEDDTHCEFHVEVQAVRREVKEQDYG